MQDNLRDIAQKTFDKAGKVASDAAKAVKNVATDIGQGLADGRACYSETESEIQKESKFWFWDSLLGIWADNGEKVLKKSFTSMITRMKVLIKKLNLSLICCIGMDAIHRWNG